MIKITRWAFLGITLSLIAALAVTAQQPPRKDGAKGDGKGEGKVEGKGKGGFGKGGPGGFPGGPGGPGGGFGFGARPKPGTVLPTQLQEVLKMSDEQKQELEALQKMVDERLAKILTEEQQKQLKEMGERGPGGFGGPGGPGGGFGRPGGPGGPGGAGGPGGRPGVLPKKDNN